MLYPALLVLGIWGTHTLVVTEMRHRWTVEPVMLLFMAPAFTHLTALAVRGETPRCTEIGDAPAEQGEKRENAGSI